jgi:2-methylcitrate dehydratase PrpD
VAHYLDTLSDFVADTTFDDLSEDAVAAVRDVVMDTVGAIIAGNRLPENRALGDLIARQSAAGESTILGREHRVTPMMATLVNSTIGTSFELDEGNNFGGGHPAIHSMPGALATAEDMGASGKRFMESFIVGYEIESRLGRATRSRTGAHPHGNWGAPATAAAIAHLRGYDAARTREAINVASSMSPANTWTPCYEGATIRNVYSGRSGFQGVLAVDLLESGFTGVADGPSDVYGTLVGDSFDPDVALQDLGSGPLRIEQNYVKFHACCRINHSALDAVEQARARAEVRPEAIEAVRIFTARPMEDDLAGMVGPYPENMLSAKFNIPFAVAALLVRGRADIDAFLPDSIEDPVIRDLAGRVTVDVDPALGPGFSQEQPGPIARAEIQQRDGRLVTGDASVIFGDLGNRAPRQELVEKFKAIAGAMLPDAQLDDVIRACQELDELDDVREMTRLTVPSTVTA